MKIKITVRQALEALLVPALQKLGNDLDNTPDPKVRYRCGRTVVAIQEALAAAEKADAELWKKYGTKDGEIVLKRIEVLRAEITADTAHNLSGGTFKPTRHKEMAIGKLEARLAAYLAHEIKEPLTVPEDHPEREAFNSAHEAIRDREIETHIDSEARVKITEHKMTGDELAAVAVFIAVE